MTNTEAVVTHRGQNGELRKSKDELLLKIPVFPACPSNAHSWPASDQISLHAPDRRTGSYYLPSLQHQLTSAPAQPLGSHYCLPCPVLPVTTEHVPELITQVDAGRQLSSLEIPTLAESSTF